MIRDPKVYLLALVYFLLLGATYTMVFWLPTLIQSWGVKDLLLIGIYSAIPNAIGVVGMILIGLSSDKHHERRWHFAACDSRRRDRLVDYDPAAGTPGRIDSRAFIRGDRNCGCNAAVLPPSSPNICRSRRPPPALR